jgi:hypothetical protein
VIAWLVCIHICPQALIIWRSKAQRIMQRTETFGGHICPQTTSPQTRNRSTIHFNCKARDASQKQLQLQQLQILQQQNHYIKFQHLQTNSASSTQKYIHQIETTTKQQTPTTSSSTKITIRKIPTPN